MSSNEIKALTARNDDWFNIPIDGYVDNAEEENKDYNPDEDVESMFLTVVDCGVLKRYIESEETYQGSLVCDDCLRKNCRTCNQLNSPFSDLQRKEFLTTWQNTFIIANQEEKGKYQIMSLYTYRTDPSTVGIVNMKRPSKCRN